MKIDLMRKPVDYMETIIIMLGENGDVGALEHLPKYVREAVAATIKEDEFKFDFAAVKSFSLLHAKKRSKVILCGVGNLSELTTNKMRETMAAAIRAALGAGAKEAWFFLGFESPMSEANLGHILAETALLVAYKFDKYLEDKKSPTLEAIHLAMVPKSSRNINRGILEGRIYAEATNLARDLVNEPANVIYPETLADFAKKAALKYGFSIDVFNEDKLRRLKMEAFLSVSKGSEKEAKLILMHYNGNPDPKAQTVALVGKGLTYDSGGYCIKTAQGMLTMKCDMAGAAAVIGTFAAISTLKLKVNVVGVIAACENMISGGAYHNGDIIRSMSGKTIEVINTDAEGRLTLVDAIHYANSRMKVHKIIDIATLTGAAAGALGNQITAVLGNDDKMMAKMKEAADHTGDLVWELPLHKPYLESLRSEIADLKNGAPVAGAITAALFIQEFVGSKPWLHLDIAGTSLKDKPNGVNPYGATGVGVRLLTQFLRTLGTKSA
ncbi:MAG: leucyl aminopeptidase [Candidatus Cloacimonadaceae bacterium]|jgi:leucyl aminopeptidase|nr:leucyl aminopeptidase [Candidatus Cloacimonadota bacterium]MDX9949317.1 leucyl aminopeptidase [Candidatus Syntrophosphaera sp.]NLN84834.1 leucyl aminopeptidase [Candidatus Cloacimonadota bacterium]